MSDPLVRTSKFLSYILRHNPDALGLDLEPGGWTDLDALLDRAQSEGRSIDRGLVERVIAHGDKDRFAISDDGTKIRANYGHSLDVELDLEPTTPPPRLYHGTTQQALPSIREEGLRPQSRQYVHLSSTRQQAHRVGSRHGSPVVLIVQSQAFHNAGHALYRSTDAVWLTNHVPRKFLQLPQE